jgi:hypothetical protein
MPIQLIAYAGRNSSRDNPVEVARYIKVPEAVLKVFARFLAGKQ